MGHDASLGWLLCVAVNSSSIITSPLLSFFEETDPTYAYVLKGYAQLSLLRDIVEVGNRGVAIQRAASKSTSFDKVTVIPLLKDFASIRYEPHSSKPYHDQCAVFRPLFVGRIAPHKCQHELIDFVDAVRSIGRVPLELVLVGHFGDANRYKSYLDELVRRSGLGRYVKFTGRVTDQELFGWYRAANAYVSLSEHEGFGVPLVEAMALDLPVIAYASSGRPGHAGRRWHPDFRQGAGANCPNRY